MARLEALTVVGTDVVGRWESVESYALDAKRGTENRAAGSGASSTKNPSPDWDLGQGFDLVFERAINGWPEVSERIRQIAMPIVSKVTQHVEQDHYDFVDDGSTASGFDVATALTGEPSCWLQHRTEIVDGKGQRIVRIGAMFSNHCGIRGDAMVRRGVVAAAIAYCLEAAGYGTEIVALSGQREGSSRMWSIVKVKRAGEMLDLNRAAVALANPGMLRRLQFGIVEGDERVHRDIRSNGYGIPTDPSSDMLKAEGIDHFVSTDVVNLDDAGIVSYVLDALRKQGVALK